MEPIVSFSGASITLTELLLAGICVLVAVLVTAWAMRRGQSHQSAQLQRHLGEMRAEQSRLQGRLAQFAEDSERRDATFADVLDTRLSGVSDRLHRSLEVTQSRTGENLSQLHERLALIDAAQSNIRELAGEVSGLQSVLSNKQARGAFGEKQMQDLIRTFLPARSFSFQHTLSNRTRVDALIHMPEGHGDVAVDSKFPMESWRRMVAAENTSEAETASRAFRRDVQKHIRDIADKYLLPEETHELALMFLPSDAIFAELHARFDAVVDQGFAQRVVIVSPTTFMATLHTMQSVMNDADIQKHAALIKREVARLAEDVGRLDARAEKLQRHFDMAVKDVSDLRISAGKITKSAGRIGQVQLDRIEPDAPQLKLVGDGDGA